MKTAEPEPPWITLLRTVPDNLTSLFPSEQLRHVAQVFAHYVDEEDASRETCTAILSNLGAGDVSMEDLGFDEEIRLNFNEFLAVVLSVIGHLHKKLEEYTPKVIASEVVWSLLESSVPLIVREDTSQSKGRFGSTEEVAQDNQSADIDQRRGIAEFEERLEKQQREANGSGWKRKKVKAAPFGVFEWTKELSELEMLHHTTPKKVWSRTEIGAVLRTLSLPECKITTLDEGMLYFVNCEKLNLSGNDLHSIGMLPPKLLSLVLNDNLVHSLEKAPTSPSLRFLGLTFNKITVIPRGLHANKFPLLSILDLTGNDVSDLDSMLQSLAALYSLSHLYLIKNPVTLVAEYRRRVLYVLPDLAVLDDIPNESTPESEEETPPHSIPDLLIRATVTSLTGLPGIETDVTSSVVGRIQIGLHETASNSEEIPWSANLVNDQPTDDISEHSKASKGKGGNTPTPEPAESKEPASRDIILRLSPTPELRDYLYFDGKVRVVR